MDVVPEGGTGISVLVVVVMTVVDKAIICALKH
jgi:hypothetical protein